MATVASMETVRVERRPLELLAKGCTWFPVAPLGVLAVIAVSHIGHHRKAEER
jgi:hypothetical protein